MKVLLVSENRVKENLIPYPLGIACIAASAKEAGHEVMGLDLMFSEDPAQEVTSAIEDFDPDCIGIAVRNIDNQDKYQPEFYLPEVKEIVLAIKSVTEVPVILGGAGFTIFPLQCLEYLDLELGIVGEGEVSFVALLRRLERDEDIFNLPGLAYRLGGKSGVNPPGEPPEFNLLPPPDRSAPDIGPYRWATRDSGHPYTANLQSRRGCPMHCIYCPNPLVEGRMIRMRDPSSVAEELQTLEKVHGIKFVFFTDSLFNYPFDYTLELCKEIRRRGLSLQWTCSFYPSSESLRLLEPMREAGCINLSLGNESGSDYMLDALKKGFSKNDVMQIVREAQRVGMRVNCFLLLGGPGETRQTIEESVEFLSDLAPDQVSITVGIRIYPGCELHELALREKMITPEQNLLFPTFFLAPEVEPWLREYMLEVCRERPGWFL
jgi:radical SAM superfamily enzyme YgiQ (UPF0313 family)